MKSVFQINSIIKLILFIMPVNIVHAEQFFCRADTRSPDKIFFQGFKSWGKEKSILKHVTGETSYPGTGSAFIATSDDINTCRRFLSTVTMNGTAYIYKIRPDFNFYSVNGSLKNLLNNIDVTSANRLAIQKILDDFEDENEYLAELEIQPNQIHSVETYKINNLKPNLEKISNNPGYKDIPTNSNPNPYLSYEDMYNIMYFYKINGVTNNIFLADMCLKPELSKYVVECNITKEYSNLAKILSIDTLWP